MTGLTGSERVLIVLHGALGDVIRALPLASRIKSAHPDCHLGWAVEPLSYDIVRRHPAVNEVFLFNRPEGLSAYCAFVQELRGGEFDVVLDLQRHLKSGFTSWSTGAKRRIGFDRKNAKEGNWLFSTESIAAVPNFSPKIEHYQMFGDVLNLPRPASLDFGISATSDERQQVETLLRESAGGEIDESKRFILIVGSSWKSRFWTVEGYRALVEMLDQKWGGRAILVGGPGEAGFAKTVSESSSAINLVGKTSLGQLLALLERSRAAIGSDSGPMHLASAAGTPVISLWGATSPRRSAPYGNEELVLQSAIGCSPCYRRDCPGLDRLCMKLIPAEAVIAQVDRVLASRL